MTQTTQLQIAIVGGGLAGLSLAILCAKDGHMVQVFEKGNYPSHKVCGEYVSLESWNFLCDTLGLNLSAHQLPMIKKLQVSSHSGTLLNADLPLGGFGISRHLLDDLLYRKAIEQGVQVHTNCTVQQISYIEGLFELKDQSGHIHHSVLCIATHGKRSNIDQALKRDFFINTKEKHNYVAVKYHLRSSAAHDTIALHNFDDGYCGFSKIEADLYCLCYLTTAQNLKKHGSIENLEKNVLHKNPFLKKIFCESEFVWDKPLTISQINFSKKELCKDHVIFAGDAAGLIQPLCGNGMSMAFHTAYMLHKNIRNYKTHNSIQKIEAEYKKDWRHTFGTRLYVARLIEKLFGKRKSTALAIGLLKSLPWITQKIIRLTHGKEIIS